MSQEEILHKIGLTDKEIKLYKLLLKHGRATPTTLSKLTNINRATIYNIAKSLLSKGIIAEDLSSPILHFVALSPKNLHKIIERSKRELKEKEELIKKAIQELSLAAVEKENYSIPKIRFIEEKHLKDFLYENGDRWIDEALNSDGTWWGFQDHSLVEQYEDWIFWLWKRKKYQNPHFRAQLLSNNSKVEEKMEKKISRNKRDIRYVDNINFISTIWVVGDYLIMVCTQQHPFYLIEIHDKTVSHNLREVFKKLWKLTLK